MARLILGIDPGTRITGFGLIEVQGDRMVHIRHGVIELGEVEALPLRLAVLADAVADILRQHQPQDFILEKIFLGKNTDSAFKLGHARGVLMAEASRAQVPVTEYAARQVKKGVTGNGGASKEEAQMVVQNLLRIGAIQRIDASDALALACYHAFELQKKTLLRRAVEA